MITMIPCDTRLEADGLANELARWHGLHPTVTMKATCWFDVTVTYPASKAVAVAETIAKQEKAI